MPTKGGKVNAEKDADLLKAVIKASGGITGKGKDFWTVVANNMDEKISWDAARKRFDKFKPETEDENAAGEAGGAARTTFKVAVTPRKRGPAKPKATKATAKSKGKKEDAEDDDTESGSQKADDVEDVTIAKGEDDSKEGEDVETIPTNITPEEKKVKKAAHPHKPKTAQDSVATETDVKATKKRDRAEDDGSEDTTEGEGGEIELAVKTLPTPPRPTKRGRPSKADIVAKEALAAGPVDETEGQEV